MDRTRSSTLCPSACLELRPRGAQVRGLRSLGSAGQRLRHRYLLLTGADQEASRLCQYRFLEVQDELVEGGVRLQAERGE